MAVTAGGMDIAMVQDASCYRVTLFDFSLQQMAITICMEVGINTEIPKRLHLGIGISGVAMHQHPV